MPQKILREYTKDKGVKISIRISHDNLMWLYALTGQYETKISYVVDAVITCVRSFFMPFIKDKENQCSSGPPSFLDVSHSLMLEKDIILSIREFFKNNKDKQ